MMMHRVAGETWCFTGTKNGRSLDFGKCPKSLKGSTGQVKDQLVKHGKVKPDFSRQNEWAGKMNGVIVATM
jgi:hypothetical protein